MIKIDSGVNGVTVESVDTLYTEYTRMDVPDYYAEHGGVNPFEGRTKVIPRTATIYAMIPEGDEANIKMARLLLKGAGKRRKVREIVCTKNELNFNQFVKGSRIVVLYV